MEQFSYNELLANYDIRRLQQNEKINAFDCGDADLNDFIINEAHLYRNELIAVSYVLENKTTKDVTAYFSLANDRVSVTDFESNRFRRKRFAYEKSLDAVPFYERNDFSLLKSKDEDLVTRLLFFDLASAK